MLTIRHERAFVMIATYAIGFTTAYITFGVADFSTSTPQMASVYEATQNENVSPVLEPEVLPVVEEVVVNEVVEPESTSASLEYKEGKLEYMMAADVILLSFNPEISNISLNNLDLKQGYHYGDLTFTMFDFGKYVFFCEQHDPKDETCTPYLYDTTASRILNVTHHGNPIEVSDKEAKVATFTINGLQIGDFTSVNSLEPQALKKQDENNTEFDLQVQ